MADRNLVVRVIGDESDYVRSLKRSTAETKQFDNTVTRSATRVDAAFTKINKARTGAFVVGAVVAAAVAGIKRTTDAASALNEQISASRVIFAGASRSVEDWSKSTADAIGVSRTEALKATNTFGGLFDTVGLQGTQAAQFSKQLVQLAGDLASFRDADPSEVLDALRSGLIGEAEPMRRFGALLSEARVQQEAFAQTGKTSAAALTDQEKVLARVTLIMRDTVNAQGDAARTAESLANQQRRLAANAADLEANLGQLLLPAVTKITGALADATDGALALSNALAKLGDVRIPEIKIPIVGEFGGGDIGGAVGGFLGNALDPKSIALRLHPAGLVADTALEIKKLFERDAAVAIPQLTRDITDIFDSMFTDALKGVKPTVDPSAFANLPGVDFDHGGIINKAIDDFIKGAQKAIDDATKEVNKGLNAEKAEKAAQKQRDAFAKFIQGLELGVDRATLSNTLKDDLVALNALKAGLERQVGAGVDVAAAQSQLVHVTKQIADTQKQINDNLTTAAQSRLQARQFRALGLSAAGDEIVPSVANLRKQLDALSKAVIGEEVPQKLLNRLAGVRKILSGQFGKATEETRRAINELFRAIRGEFDKETGPQGSLTKTTQANISALTKGLTLPFEDLKTLQARLSRLNTAGLQLAGPGGRAGAFGVPVSAANAPIVIENRVILDGKEIATSTTRHQQKTSRRGTASTRGPFAGRRSGV